MRRVTAQGQFATSHKDEACAPYLHGHTFHVIATEIGIAEYDLLEDLDGVVGELHLHSLDEMLVGGGQDLESMSAWVMERLVMRHPRLTMVEMWTADRPALRVGVEREVRR